MIYVDCEQIDRGGDECATDLQLIRLLMLTSTIQVKKRRVLTQYQNQNNYVLKEHKPKFEGSGQFGTTTAPSITFNHQTHNHHPQIQQEYRGEKVQSREDRLQRRHIFEQHHDHQWQKVQAKEQQFNLFNLSSVDLAHYIEQQIIQMEESPARINIEELKKKGLKFIDERFPANHNSLCGEWKSLNDWKDIKWNKISHMMPQSKIFIGRPQPNDIKQGILGDCYFLAGLAAICQRPDRIFNLFLTQQENEQRYYSVKMLYKGKWMVIDVDQFIPFHGTVPAFSKSTNGELWVILLQKAWAKLYSSYKRIESGFPQETLHDLTGAPIHSIEISKNMNQENEWSYLLRATQLQYAMVCSSKPGSDTETSQSGIVQGHAYTLLAALMLNFKGQNYRLIKLRNPWGKVEFKGQWSDYDENWNLMDARQKKRLGYSNNKDDGVFFMTFGSFCEQFKSITVGQINDNASYVYKSAKDPHRQGCYFRIQIKKEGMYSLQVDKTPQRSFQNKRQNAYNYPRATIDLAQFKQLGVQKLQGVMSSSRTTFLKYKMSPGKFIAKVLIEFDSNYETDYDVNLAIYGEYPCSIEYATNQEACKMVGKAVSWKGQEQVKPQIWNHLSAWGYKPKQEQQACFLLGVDQPNKHKGQAKAYEAGTTQNHGVTAWDMLSNMPLSDLVSKGTK